MVVDNATSPRSAQSEWTRRLVHYRKTKLERHALLVARLDASVGNVREPPSGEGSYVVEQKRGQRHALLAIHQGTLALIDNHHQSIVRQRNALELAVRFHQGL